MSNTIDKVLNVAIAEDGYLEKKTNSNLDSKSANSGSNNFTKYWRDIAPSMNGQYWCLAFLVWSFNKAYGEKTAKKLLCMENGWTFYTPTSAQYFKNKGQFYTSKPKVGDIIYFKNSERICHVGLVIKVDSSYVYTVEGNTSSAPGLERNGGAVNAHKKYSLTYSNIAGYGRPKYDVDSKPASSTSTASKLATSTSSKTSYYPKCDAKYTGLVDALNSIKVDSSKANRTKIAKANGIANYTGTATENSDLLSRLKKGTLKKA